MSESLEWRRRGKCRPYPKYLFYPDSVQDTGQIAFAKRICNGCPVRETCLDWAVRHHEYGIWAGSDERERVLIRSLFPELYRPNLPTEASATATSSGENNLSFDFLSA
jgi:WhiB family redox-sensing transcriptional regulator